MHPVAFLVTFTIVLVCTAFTLFRLVPFDLDMRFSRTYVPLFFASLGAAEKLAQVDLGWYAPKKSWINDLAQTLNGTGTNGFVFNSSQLPTGVEYGTYNWCNMPHTRKEEYMKVGHEFELVYVEV